jgi:hypothetical protein
MDSLTMFSILLCLIIFVVFFVIGYFSMKRSGGFFLFLAGFVLINVAVSAYAVLGAVSTLIVFFGAFIILSGIMKAFFQKTSQPESGGRIQGS